MSSPSLDDRDRAAVMRVLGSDVLSIGPYVDAFEAAVARRAGTAHAAAVSSGTAGLHLGLIAAGVTDGDVVITTPFSFVASANVVLYERALPVFVDVDAETGNIDPRLVSEAVEDLVSGGARAAPWLPPSAAGAAAPAGARVKAVLPVHAFGQPADMDPLIDVAGRYGLRVIEDACEAIGATYKGRAAGSIGDAGVYAFYPNKQMTTGEGGVIVTRHADWDALFRSLRNQGRDVFDAWLTHSRLGFNYRMDEMSAALGLSQHDRLDELLGRRARVAAWYRECLAGVPCIVTPEPVGHTTAMSWFVYVIRVVPPLERGRLMARLGERGIPSRPYFTPIHLQPLYVERFGYQRGRFPVTERLGDTSLALPFSSVMSRAQVEEVSDTLRQVVLSAV